MTRASQIDFLTGMAEADYTPKTQGARRAAKRERVNVAGIEYVDVNGCLVPAEFVRERVRVRRPEDALSALAPLRTASQEVFAVLTLDGAHNLIAYHEVTRGLVNQSQVHPRETFRPAILDAAVGVIVAHNHPSGSTDPSAEDLTATRRLADAGRLLGIPVLDHLIVTAADFMSIRERFPDYFSGK